MRFRLKIFPDGKKMAEEKGQVGAGISFDHTMTPLLKVNDFNFERRIAIVNKRNPDYLLENKRTYQVADYKDVNWGNSKIASHDELQRFGFVSQDGKDTVTVRVFVRRASYY